VLTRVDHIDLKVPDLTIALDFFAGLGFVEIRRTPARGSVEIALSGQGQVIFELREDPGLDRFVMDHIAFGSTDQAVDVATLTAAGRSFQPGEHLHPGDRQDHLRLHRSLRHPLAALGLIST